MGGTHYSCGWYSPFLLLVLRFSVVGYSDFVWLGIQILCGRYPLFLRLVLTVSVVVLRRCFFLFFDVLLSARGERENRLLGVSILPLERDQPPTGLKTQNTSNYVKYPNIVLHSFRTFCPSTVTRKGLFIVRDIAQESEVGFTSKSKT